MIKIAEKIQIKDLTLNLDLLDQSSEQEFNIYLELFYKCFGFRENIDRSVFQWLNNKNQNLTFIFKENDKHRYIAAYSLLITNSYYKGEIFASAVCNNVMTDSQYRGRKLFEQIGTHTINYINKTGVDIILGIPNNNALDGHLNIGWKQLPQLFFFQKTIDNYSAYSSNEYIQTATCFFKEENESIAVFLKKYEYCLNRDNDWLNWRIGKPNCNYSILKYKSGIDLKGYLVFKIFLDPVTSIKKMHVIDYNYDESLHFKALLQELELISKNKGCHLINCWCLNDTGLDGATLAGMNFENSNISNNLIINTNLILQNADFDRWHLTLADNDVF